MSESEPQASATNPPRPPRTPDQSMRQYYAAKVRHGLELSHEFFARHPRLVPIRKVLVAIVGIILIGGGILIAPIPGPGGFIAFIGIAMLAAEFRWVRRVVRWTQALAVLYHLKLTGRRPNWAFRIKRRLSVHKPNQTRARAGDHEA